MKVYHIDWNFKVSPTKDKNSNISFQSMKPSQFIGFDYACVRKFKAPVEKFNITEDLYKWADNIIKKILNRNFDGRQQTTLFQRKSMLNEWSKYITEENQAINPALALIILSSIVKDLKTNNDKLPPVLNKRVLADSISDLNIILTSNKDTSFDFAKLYSARANNLYKSEIDNSELISSGWIKIPSLAHDRENFSSNVDKLKAFSADSWCTKSFNAEPYLSRGDFHIFFYNGIPRIGLRFDKDKLVEIQNEKNNNIISLKYFDILKSYIDKNSFNMNSLLKEKVVDANKKKKLVTNICYEIGTSVIKDNNVYKIMDYLGFEPKYLDDGTISIKKYNFLNIGFNMSFEDMGINENKLFVQISEIRENAVFIGMGVTNLGSLRKILGNANFETSSVMTLGNLEEINGFANFANSMVNSLGGLKKIGSWADFENSILEDTGMLESIGKDAYFNNSKIKKVSALRHIGGIADISNTELSKNLFKNIFVRGGIINY